MQERPLPQWLLNLEAKKRARRAKDVKRKKIAAAKTVAKKDYLDANNRKMGWKTFAQLEDEAAERQRKADAREPESPRAFPFELLQTDVYDDSAVARYAYMHGTHRQFKEPDENDPDLGWDGVTGAGPPPLPPDLLDKEVEEMKQPDLFLRLDESKLPIETFDSAEYEELDKSPEEWMATARKGKNPKDEPFVPGFAAYFVMNAKGASGGPGGGGKRKLFRTTLNCASSR